MFEFSGILVRVDQITNFESSRGGIFATRTFVMRYLDHEGREQLVKFNIDPPVNMNLIEQFEPGDDLKIKFYLCGREVPSKFDNGVNLFEKKRVTSIDKIVAKESKTPQKFKPPTYGYVGPDLTLNFSRFPDTIDF